MDTDSLIIPKRKYDCIDCGRCCRDWHVELSREEVDRLRNLNWPSGDGPKKSTMRIHGMTVIAHRPDGTCIYFDRDRKRCMIHAEFGYAAKPMGCRLYPFNLATDGADHVSVAGRFDCPAIRSNEGTPFEDRRDELQALAGEIGVRPSKATDLDLDGLQPNKVDEFIESIQTYVIRNDKVPVIHALMLGQTAISRFQDLTMPFINEMDMSEIFPSFFVRLTKDHGLDKPRRLGGFEQTRFLSLMLSFLRRDSEQLGQGGSGRIGRTLTLIKVLRGSINLHRLSNDYPDFAMSRKTFFSVPVLNPDELEGALIKEWIGHRLETRQFFGPSTYNRSVFFGLKSAFMLGALALAVAKWLAVARQGIDAPCRITNEDFDHAVGAIDHPYGRSPLLGLGFMNTMQRQVCDPDAFKRIVNEIVHPMPKPR